MVFMMVCEGINCPQNPRSFHPVDSPENSSFDEVTSTLSMGWNVDRLETVSGTRTELAHGAWGSDSGGFTKGLANASLGANAKS